MVCVNEKNASQYWKLFPCGRKMLPFSISDSFFIFLCCCIPIEKFLGNFFLRRKTKSFRGNENNFIRRISLSFAGSIYRRGARRWRKLYRINGHIFQAKRFNRVSPLEVIFPWGFICDFGGFVTCREPSVLTVTIGFGVWDARDLSAFSVSCSSTKSVTRWFRSHAPMSIRNPLWRREM